MRAPGNAAPQAPAHVDGQQLVHWFTVQGDMAGILQRGVRALTSRARNPDVIPQGPADELARLREQLHNQRRNNLEMKQTLQNQALEIDAYQHKWQLAGQEAQSFGQPARNDSEDFVCCDLVAVERFESTLQKEYDAQLHTRMHALQDECRDHVTGNELKMRAELQQAPQHEFALCRQSTPRWRSPWTRSRKPMSLSLASA